MSSAGTKALRAIKWPVDHWIISTSALVVLAGVWVAIVLVSPASTTDQAEFYDERGGDVSHEMSRYIGVAGPDGNTARCEDGNPARLPAGGIPEDMPVYSVAGDRYESFAEATSASQARLAAEGDVQVDQEDGEMVVLGDDDLFYPEIDEVCRRFGTGPMD